MSEPAELSKGRGAVEEVLLSVLAVEGRRTNPLLFDIPEALAILDRYFPLWREFPDLARDARGLNAVSRVLQMQESRLRYEASLFHADPGYLVEKLRKLPEEALTAVLLAAFHPIVEQEQVVPDTFDQAMQYYAALPPWESRRRRRELEPAPEPRKIPLEELVAQGLLERQGFEGGLMRLNRELAERGPLDYQAFIRGANYTETVQRAYGVSFLVTYGYADLYPRDGGLELSPKGVREMPEHGHSLPISLAVNA